MSCQSIVSLLVSFSAGVYFMSSNWGLHALLFLVYDKYLYSIKPSLEPFSRFIFLGFRQVPLKSRYISFRFPAMLHMLELGSSVEVLLGNSLFLKICHWEVFPGVCWLVHLLQWFYNVWHRHLVWFRKSVAWRWEESPWRHSTCILTNLLSNDVVTKRSLHRFQIWKWCFSTLGHVATLFSSTRIGTRLYVGSLSMTVRENMSGDTLLWFWCIVLDTVPVPSVNILPSLSVALMTNYLLNSVFCLQSLIAGYIFRCSIVSLTWCDEDRLQWLALLDRSASPFTFVVLKASGCGSSV